MSSLTTLKKIVTAVKRWQRLCRERIEYKAMNVGHFPLTTTTKYYSYTYLDCWSATMSLQSAMNPKV